ncbi:NifB/NifX family molybdenum-iron cluster-binding protein [candidate division KSB1 bacterium]|nr:NifB/NifX family molybdenum-iron cluster-binding protein [candidate division KSB1 bacterium]
MKKILITFSFVLFISVFSFQVQQGLSFTSNSDVDSLKASDRIAIAAVGDSVNSEISSVAGRAPYYLIFDGNGVFLKAIKNPSQNRRGGASSVVVNILIKESVKTVIANKFGDKMKNRLKANKIDYHEHTGSVNNILETVIKNKRSKNVQK